MTLHFFYDESFTIGTQLDPIDAYVSNGGSTYTLVNKSSLNLAGTITANNLQYYQFNGGFSVSGNNFTLSTSPPAGAMIVAPGLIALTFTVFDQLAVPGVSNPNVQEVPFFLGDPSQSCYFGYTNLPQFGGIRITFTDQVSGSGAQLSWVQLACSDPLTGLAMTYGATGNYLETGGLTSLGTMSASSLPGASSISTISASSYVVGDYMILNIGNATSEIRKISAVTSSTVSFVTTLTYTHFAGESLNDMGRKFWAKVTVPQNAANNQPFNFWNLGLRRQALVISKV